MKTLADLKDIEVDDLLGVLGLTTRRSSFASFAPIAGFFVLGLLVGAGVALLVTPTTGSDLLTNIKERIREQKSQDHTPAGKPQASTMS